MRHMYLVITRFKMQTWVVTSWLTSPQAPKQGISSDKIQGSSNQFIPFFSHHKQHIISHFCSQLMKKFPCQVRSAPSVSRQTTILNTDSSTIPMSSNFFFSNQNLKVPLGQHTCYQLCSCKKCRRNPSAQPSNIET